MRFPVYFFCFLVVFQVSLMCSLFYYPFQLPKIWGLKVLYKWETTNRAIGLTDRYPVVFHCRFCTFVGLYPTVAGGTWYQVFRQEVLPVLAVHLISFWFLLKAFP